MKVLLDECVAERLRNSLPGHECQSARYAGLAGLANGDLLAAAEAAKFDVLLTVDRGFEYQQNLSGRRIAILILETESIRLEDLLAHIPTVLVALQSIKPGQVIRVGSERET
jgi:predicted nuclease of predicted toxin-antitoxin system